MGGGGNWTTSRVLNSNTYWGQPGIQRHRGYPSRSHQPTKCCRQNLKYPDFHEKSSDFFESGMGQRCARQQNISANQLAASGLQAEDPPGPSFLFYMMFGVIQQLACKPSIQKGIWTTGKMVTGSVGPSNDYKLCSSFITVSAAPSVINENPDGTADFWEGERGRTMKGNKRQFLTVKQPFRAMVCVRKRKRKGSVESTPWLWRLSNSPPPQQLEGKTQKRKEWSKHTSWSREAIQSHRRENIERWGTHQT